MDWYSYFKERFSWGSNPYEATARCQRIVMEMMNNPIIPLRISAEVATGFLAALYDFAGDGCTVTHMFRVIMESLTDELQRAFEVVEAKDRAWAKEAMEAERADVDGPPYAPDDYEVRDEDLDGEDEDGMDDAPVLEEMYGTGGEPGSTGTRRPFPDWQHISSWTRGDWIALQTYKDKVIAASEAGFMGISSVAGVLAAAKGAMTEIPLSRQVELCMWATEVVDGLIFSLEDDLQAMCAGSLHSHAGRLVQKQLLSDATEHPENTPI